jgi:hypothetical protein
LADVTPGNWRHTFEVFWQAHTRGLLSDEEYRLMLSRVGEVAGGAALDRFKPKDPVGQAETHNARHAMAGWAQTDPAAALSYVQSQPEGRFREGMTWGYIAGVATRDPQAANRALMALPLQKQTEWLRNWLSQANPSVFEPLARQWLSGADASEGDHAARSLVFDALFATRSRRNWADPDGSKLASFVEEFVGQPFLGPGPVANAAHLLAARQGYAKAIAWAESNAPLDSSDAGSVMGEVVARWANTDAQAASGWLDSHRESPYYDAAVATFLRSAKGLDHPTAQAWAATIRDPALRASLPGRLRQNQP